MGKRPAKTGNDKADTPAVRSKGGPKRRTPAASRPVAASQPATDPDTRNRQPSAASRPVAAIQPVAANRPVEASQPAEGNGASEVARRILDTLRVPKHVWKTWSGKSTKELHDLHRNLGAPLYGRVIDVAEAVRWYTRYVSRFNRTHKGGGRLAPAGLAAALDDEGESDPNMVGPLSPALEKYREERAKIARLTRLEMEKTLIPADTVRQVHNQWADRLVKAQEELERDHGDEASGVLTMALADCERMVRAGMGG